jgi:hypothetical protein
VYFVSGMDISNITLDTEQFETIEEALKRACEIEKTGALVELFEDDNPVVAESRSEDPAKRGAIISCPDRTGQRRTFVRFGGAGQSPASY